MLLWVFYWLLVFLCSRGKAMKASKWDWATATMASRLVFFCEVIDERAAQVD